MKSVPLEEARAATGLSSSSRRPCRARGPKRPRAFSTSKASTRCSCASRAPTRRSANGSGSRNVPVLLAPGSRFARTGPRSSRPRTPRRRPGGLRRSFRPTRRTDATLGLAHELLGDNGLVWSSRLLVIHRGLVTGGEGRLPLFASRSTSPRSTDTPPGAPKRRARAYARCSIASRGCSRARIYALGGALTALDLYLATAIAPLAPMSPELCPDMHPVVRHAFGTAAPDLSSAMPAALVAHRNRVCTRLGPCGCERGGDRRGRRKTNVNGSYHPTFKPTDTGSPPCAATFTTPTWIPRSRPATFTTPICTPPTSCATLTAASWRP